MRFAALVDGKKRCSRCGEWKLLADFYKNNSATTGLTPECKICHKRWSIENPSRGIDYHLIVEKLAAQLELDSAHPVNQT